MMISLCVAMDRKGLIGRGNELPWGHIPADMRRFREVTLGKTVLMGSRTWLSLPSCSRPLPDRHNIVLTRDTHWAHAESLRVGLGTYFAFYLTSALDWARERGDEELVVIGGAEVYKQTLPLADRVYLTIVHGEHKGDVFFPGYSRDETTPVREFEGFGFEADPRSTRSEIECSFATLDYRPGTRREN